MKTALQATLRLLLLPGRLLIHEINRRKVANGVPPLNRFLRGSVHAFVWFWVFVLTVTTAPTNTATSSGTAAAAPSVVTSTSPAAAPTAASSAPVLAAPEPEPIGEAVTVARVIDGDTFELADGRRVRVLGIDSCEMDTPGGEQAKIAARSVLAGTAVLTEEPGVDTDRYGRLLRYVQTPYSGDLGEYLVRDDHTGVYQGDNDASNAYLQRLYAKDLINAMNPPSGRECGTYPPTPADDDTYVSVPDDDDDGRESRFCRGRWWC